LEEKLRLQAGIDERHAKYAAALESNKLDNGKQGQIGQAGDVTRDEGKERQ